MEIIKSAGREKEIQSHILWLFTNTKFTTKDAEKISAEVSQLVK